MKRTFALAATLAAGVAMAPMAADAAFVLQIDDTGTGFGPEVSISDAGSNDGLLTHAGSVGTYNVNVTTGLSKPLLGSATVPEMDLNSVDVSGGASSLLRIKLTDTGFTATTPFTLSLGGTTTGVVNSVKFYADIGNGEFATTTLLGSFGAFSGVASPNAFSGQLNSASATVGSLTIIAELTHAAAGMVTSFDAHITPVPVPAALPLMLTALAGLGLIGRRKMKPAA